MFTCFLWPKANDKGPILKELPLFLKPNYNEKGSSSKNSLLPLFPSPTSSKSSVSFLYFRVLSTMRQTYNPESLQKLSCSSICEIYLVPTMPRDPSSITQKISFLPLFPSPNPMTKALSSKNFLSFLSPNLNQ